MAAAILRAQPAHRAWSKGGSDPHRFGHNYLPYDGSPSVSLASLSELSKWKEELETHEPESD